MKMKLKHYVKQYMEEKSSGERFDGFQTIRAIERDRFISGLATPEFATYVGNMMKNETRTEYVLKLANNKLKRALSSDQTASRTLQETTKVKHTRTTLSELFQRTKVVNEKPETKSNIGKHKEHKTNDYLMRKIPKRSTTTSNVSASADEKLHKILQMVHLEAIALSQNMRKYVKKNRVADDQDSSIFPYSARQTKSKMSYAAPNWKRERWIKSDAEYLILEL